MADDNNNNDDGVFVYTEGVVVPSDVVRVRVHPSVTVIPEEVFYRRKKLKEVELCEGLLEIGDHTFSECLALKHINIPSGATRIGLGTFSSSLSSVRLGEGLVEIGNYAFASTRLTQIRIPPLITTVPASMVSCCRTVFSVELPESIMQFEARAFYACHSLRNIALPLDAGIVDNSSSSTFYLCSDLKQIFDINQEQIINALKHRFDNLPIHKMIYYQSYNNVTSDELNTATNMRRGQRRSLRSKLDPTGRQQDCLGMTPLHILACSTVQNLQLYKILVNKYPKTLVTEDRWGAVPTLCSMGTGTR